MDKQMENLPIVQDLGPLLGPLPCFPHENQEKKVEQGKGTIDHLMALGYLLILSVLVENTNHVSKLSG